MSAQENTMTKKIIEKSTNRQMAIWVVVLFSWLSVCDAQPVWAENGKPLNLAAIFSLTGLGANPNRSSVLGTRLAVDEINTRGGLLGRNLNLIFLDNMSTPIGSSLAANQAAAADVIGIIGAQWSSHSLAIAEVAQQNRIPMVSNFSTHPKLTAIGEYIFRICYNDNLQGKVMAEFARRDLNAATAVVFVDLTSDYSLALSKIFRSHFESLGGSVVREIEYKAKDENYEQFIGPAMASAADAVFLSGHVESGIIANKLQNAGTKAVMLGGDGWADESFMTLGGKFLKRGFFCTHWSESSDRKESKDFIAKYSRRRDFGTGAALAYDAVMVLARAVEKAKSTEGPLVARALSELETYEGVTGSIKFDAQGDPLKSAVIIEIHDGRCHYLKTLAPKQQALCDTPR
jgi:branched-chain amino acid transport system substrate-binding protein